MFYILYFETHHGIRLKIKEMAKPKIICKLISYLSISDLTKGS